MNAPGGAAETGAGPGRRPPWVWVCALAAPALAAGIVLNRMYSPDIASLYGVLVRWFAAGDFARGFHPLPPPLVTFQAGLLGLLGVDAFTALKIVAAAFFLAGLWPLWHLAKRLDYLPHPAWLLAVYLTMPRLFRLATQGLLETAKVFGLLLALWLAVRAAERRAWWPAAAFGGALALLAYARGECMLFIPFFVAVFVFEAWRRRREQVRQGGAPAWARLALALLVTALICLPWCLRVHQATGFPSMDARVSEKLIWHLERHTSLPARQAAPDAAADPRLEQVARQGILNTFYTGRREEIGKRWHFWRNLVEIAEGLNALYLVLAVAGVVLLLRAGKWTRLDGYLLGLLMFNFAIFWLNDGAVDRRYVTASIPCILPWATHALARAVGVTRVWQRWPRWALALLLVATVVALWDGLSQVRTAHKPYARGVRAFGRWFEAHRGELSAPNRGGIPAALLATEHNLVNGDPPVVAATSPRYAFAARAGWAPVDPQFHISAAAMLAWLDLARADVLVVDGQMRRLCPELEDHLATDPHWRPVGRLDDHDIAIHRRITRDGGIPNAPTAAPAPPVPE